MKFSTVPQAAALVLLARITSASPVSSSATSTPASAPALPSSSSALAISIQTVTVTVDSCSNPTHSVAPNHPAHGGGGDDIDLSPTSSKRPAAVITTTPPAAANPTPAKASTTTTTKTVSTTPYVYPTDIKYYHLKIGKASNDASRATMGGSVVNKTLIADSTSSTWDTFYLDGYYLALKTPSGPLYAQLPSTFPKLPEKGYDTENIVFGPVKSGNSLVCVLASSGALSCDSPYNLFGLASGYTSPGHIVMYWIPFPGPLTAPAPTYAYPYLVAA